MRAFTCRKPAWIKTRLSQAAAIASLALPLYGKPSHQRLQFLRRRLLTVKDCFDQVRRQGVSRTWETNDRSSF